MSPSTLPLRAGAIALALTRIGGGLLFSQHGAQKLLGWFGGLGGPGQTAALYSQMGAAGVLELGGGLLLVLGLFTRPVAVILIGEMMYAFFTVHLPRGGAPMQNGGELALLYICIFVALAGLGAGAFSLDDLLFGRD
jgi:putative oxidoreductase